MIVQLHRLIVYTGLVLVQALQLQHEVVAGVAEVARILLWHFRFFRGTRVTDLGSHLPSRVRLPHQSQCDCIFACYNRAFSEAGWKVLVFILLGRKIGIRRVERDFP